MSFFIAEKSEMPCLGLIAAIRWVERAQEKAISLHEYAVYLQGPVSTHQPPIGHLADIPFFQGYTLYFSARALSRSTMQGYVHVAEVAAGVHGPLYNRSVGNDGGAAGAENEGGAQQPDSAAMSAMTAAAASLIIGGYAAVSPSYRRAAVRADDQDGAVSVPAVVASGPAALAATPTEEAEEGTNESEEFTEPFTAANSISMNLLRRALEKADLVVPPRMVWPLIDAVVEQLAFVTVGARLCVFSVQLFAHYLAFQVND